MASLKESKYINDSNTNSLLVALGSYTKIDFKCDKCNHNFMRNCNEIRRDNWCPYCADQKLCVQNCQMCFENSFASSVHSHKWSNKNKLTSRQVYKFSNNKYFLDCNVCNHTYLKRLEHNQEKF